MTERKRSRKIKPVPLPPVWCPENADGTYCWPRQIGAQTVYTTIRKPSDVPPAYLDPPVVEVYDDAD